MLISGGTVVDASGRRVADVRVGAQGHVGEVGASLEPFAGEEVHDAAGKLVVPGGVDPHTHFQLPVGPVRSADDFASGTRAAAMGGTTTVIDFVTPERGEDPLAALERWRALAAPSSVDWSLHLSFPQAVPESVIAAGVAAGVTSFKVYLAYPERLQVDDGTLLRLMGAARRQGALVALHCENGPAIEELRRQALAAGRRSVVEHARTRPPLLESEAVARAAVMAELTGAAIYVVHVSSAEALAAVVAARARGVDVRAETCPHYLYLDVGRLEGPDAADFVCSPPLRERRHAEALWEGLRQGWIETVATDHCPFTRADRRHASSGGVPGADPPFTEIPGGLPGVETRLGLVYQGVRAGRIGLEDWVRLCAEAPARIFGLWPAKGSLRPGADADVVVFDPGRRQSLDASALHMAVDHSPYAGTTVTGWPELVLSRGRVVARDGRFVGQPGWGRFLPRLPLPGR